MTICVLFMLAFEKGRGVWLGIALDNANGTCSGEMLGMHT